MKNPLLLITIGLFVLLFGGFAMGMLRGGVWGAHPVHKKVAWIAKAEHPSHFWGHVLLQIALFIILAGVILGLWTAPAF